MELPPAGQFGVGNIFLPNDPTERAHCQRVFEREVNAAGQRLLGWRELPVHPDGAGIGNAARSAMPAFAQLFIGADGIACG